MEEAQNKNTKLLNTNCSSEAHVTSSALWFIIYYYYLLDSNWWWENKEN